MKLSVLFAAAASLSFGQSSVTTYTPDLANGGNIVSSVADSSDRTQTQVTQSINGRQVPLEQHQDRIISTDANGSVTETIVRRYDPTGQLASTERTVTEQRKNPGGGSTVKATTYRSDINGSELPSERRTIETNVSGTTTTINTVVDRPNMNGAFQTAEKRVDVTQGTDKQSTTTESVYRGDPTDGFKEAIRRVTTLTKTGNQTVQDSTEYQPGITGSLQFQERRVSTTNSTPNGNQTTQVDVYAPSADGHVQDTDAKPQLKQQQIITSAKNADGSVVETFSIREPSVSDATHLGNLRQITQTVCTGKCGGDPAAAVTAAATSAASSGAPASNAKKQ